MSTAPAQDPRLCGSPARGSISSRSVTSVHNRTRRFLHQLTSQGTTFGPLVSETRSDSPSSAGGHASAGALAITMSKSMRRLCGASRRAPSLLTPAHDDHFSLADSLWNDSPLFRQLAGGYVSLYQIVRSAAAPHILCLPPDGQRLDEDTISYQFVQAHLMFPIVGQGSDWRNWTYRSLVSDSEEVSVELGADGEATALRVRRRPAPLVAPAAARTDPAPECGRPAAAGKRRSESPRMAWNTPLHTSRHSLLSPEQRRDDRGGARVRVERWGALEDSSLVVLWLKDALVAPPNRKPSLWRRPSVAAAAARQFARSRTLAETMASLGSASGGAASPSCRSAGSPKTWCRAANPPQRPQQRGGSDAVQPELCETRVTFAPQPTELGFSFSQSVGSFLASEGPQLGLAQSLLGLSFRLHCPPRPPKRPSTARDFRKWLRHRAQSCKAVGEVLAAMDEEILIVNSHYFFPPEDLSHLTPAKMTYLCESFAADVQAALADRQSTTGLAAASPKAGLPAVTSDASLSNTVSSAQSEGRIATAAVTMPQPVLGEDGVPATIGAVSPADAEDEEREVAEQAVHCWLLGGMHDRLFGRWRAIYTDREAELADTCAELVKLSWEDWQIPPGFRGDQRRAVSMCRKLHSSFSAPLEMGMELASITLVILEDSVHSSDTGSGGGDLAAEASADLLLPLLMRVVALSCAAPPPTDIAAGEEGALLLTVLAYVKDFGCPSMGFSNIAYATATFEAATEFIASGACGEVFCPDST